MNDNTATSLIKQTIPASSPLDTLKALVHQNLSMLSYVSDQLGGSMLDIDEHIFEFIDSIVDTNYDALNEHIAIESTWIGRYNQRRIAESGYIYDDGSPVKEHFDGHGLTSTYYPRYNGNRDAALARHYKSVAEMNLRFAEEMEAKAEGREWPPPYEEASEESEGLNGPSEG